MKKGVGVTVTGNKYLIAISWQKRIVCANDPPCTQIRERAVTRMVGFPGVQDIGPQPHLGRPSEHEGHEERDDGCWRHAGGVLSRTSSGPRAVCSRINKGKAEDDPKRAFVGVIDLTDIVRLDADAEAEYQHHEAIAQVAMDRASQAKARASVLAEPKSVRRKKV